MSSQSGTSSRTRPRLRTVTVAAVLALVTAGSSNAESSSIAASVQVLGLEVELALSASEARVGDKVRAQATITNVGPSRVSNITVELRVDAGVGVRSATSTTIARLQPGRSATSSWTLCALLPGNYVVLARATVDGAAVESAARLLSVSGERRRGCT